MAPIATYVFLDLGTTSKIAETAEITELCMVAVNRQDLLDTHRSSNGTPATPRVLQKLLQCYKPNSKICYEASSFGNGGFTDDILKDECPFNKTSFLVIDKFINTLQEPVCFFAHYGRHFDYPIFKRHLEKLTAKFSADRIFCADTHLTFYDLFHPKIEEKITGNASRSEDGVLAAEDTLPMKNLNERTPRKKEVVGAKRKYPSTRRPTESYELSKVYKRVFKVVTVDAHKAEIDCILMLQLAVYLGQDFVNWADEDDNCLRFPKNIGIET